MKTKNDSNGDAQAPTTEPVRVRCDALVLNLFMNENKLGGLVRTFGQAEIVDVKIFDQGAVVTLRKRSNAMYATNPPRPTPDKVWREIFRYESGELRKVETQDGVHRPQMFMPEEIVFENVGSQTQPDSKL